jgi:hypothetical protein
MRLPYYIEVTIPLSQEEFTNLVGEKCPSYDEECTTCTAHAQYAGTGTITTLVDRAVLAQQLTEGML